MSGHGWGGKGGIAGGAEAAVALRPRARAPPLAAASARDDGRVRTRRRPGLRHPAARPGVCPGGGAGLSGRATHQPPLARSRALPGSLAMANVSPATRLLEKRRQMFEVQEALEVQKQEFARKVRALAGGGRPVGGALLLRRVARPVAARVGLGGGGSRAEPRARRWRPLPCPGGGVPQARGGPEEARPGAAGEPYPFQQVPAGGAPAPAPGCAQAARRQRVAAMQPACQLQGVRKRRHAGMRPARWARSLTAPFSTLRRRRTMRSGRAPRKRRRTRSRRASPRTQRLPSCPRPLRRWGRSASASTASWSAACGAHACAWRRAAGQAGGSGRCELSG